MKQLARKLVFTVVFAAMGLVLMAGVTDDGVARTASGAAGLGAAEVALSTLPSEARETHRRILAGGPFAHDKDGSVFGNRERLLPLHARGHYREYTVKTPGASDRGARRIVCGGARPTVPDACYYTADHYSSFRLLRP